MTRAWLRVVPVLLVLAPSVVAAQQSNPPAEPESPRLRALAVQVRTGDTRALPQFWNEVRKQGAPLVEPIPGDSVNVLVTFLYRGNDSTRNVLLFRGVHVTTNLADTPLTRLDTTDVWFRSYPVRRDARFTYLIGVNVDLSAGPQQYMQQLRSFTLDPLNPVARPGVRRPAAEAPAPVPRPLGR